MQPYPQKVTNVTIYPYVDFPSGGGVGPVVLPVLKNGTGTYSVGSLITNLFYNLDIESGDEVGEFELHGRYVAHCQSADGSTFTTPWMYCTEAGSQPKFGRTIALAGNDLQHTESLGLSVPDYIGLGPLTDITVTYTLTPPAIGTILYVRGGDGNLIATRVGTPHEMGVEVTSAQYDSGLKAGMNGLMISGKNKDGKMVTMGNMTCISAEFPLVFLRVFG